MAATRAGGLKPVQATLANQDHPQQIPPCAPCPATDRVLFAGYGLSGGAKIHCRIDRCLRRPVLRCGINPSSSTCWPEDRRSLLFINALRPDDAPV